MAVIAVIDDNINSNLLRENRVIESYQIKDGRALSEPEKGAEGWTHATIIAAVLERCTENYEIINIRIFNHESPESLYLDMANLGCLKAALELCLKLPVDIVSMSLGSTQLLDALELKGIVERAADRGMIMAAALSNRKKLTVPSFLK